MSTTSDRYNSVVIHKCSGMNYTCAIAVVCHGAVVECVVVESVVVECRGGVFRGVHRGEVCRGGVEKCVMLVWWSVSWWRIEVCIMVVMWEVC